MPRLLSEADVSRATGMRPDELEAAVEAGRFPEPLALFAGEQVTHRWQPSSVREWIANRPTPPAEQPPPDED
jgi:hypothetical protein